MTKTCFRMCMYPKAICPIYISSIQAQRRKYRTVTYSWISSWATALGDAFWPVSVTVVGISNLDHESDQTNTDPTQTCREDVVVDHSDHTLARYKVVKTTMIGPTASIPYRHLFCTDVHHVFNKNE